MAKEKPTQDNYELALAQLNTVRQGQERKQRMSQAAGSGNLDTIVQDAQELLVSPNFRAEDKQAYTQGLQEAASQRNYDAIVGAWGQLHQLQYGKSVQELEKLFTGDEATKTISSAPEDFQQTLAYTIFKPNYTGEHKQAHEELAEVVLRQEIIGVVSGKRKPVHNPNLNEEKINEIASQKYKAQRTPYDEPELEKVSEKLDQLFNRPLREYLGKNEEVINKFFQETLPNAPGLLTDLASEKELIEFFMQYQTQKAEE